METAVTVENVSKIFNLNKQKTVSSILKSSHKYSDKKLVALDGISFTVSKGEMLGIIGLNGSGKTTLLRIIAGIYKSDSGSVNVKGRLAPLLHIGTGFHNELTASENIIISGLLLGMSKSEIKNRVNDIIEFAELQEFSEMKLKHYSSCMRARLAFSVAIQIDPDVLLVDEILSVGDITFRKKSFNAFLSFKEKGKTILYTTHNLEMLPKLCDRVLLIHCGKLIKIGEPNEVIQKYMEITKTNESNLEISLSDDQNYTGSSSKITVIANKKYIVSTEVTGFTGKPFSAYFGVILMDKNNNALGRRIKWLNDFSGNKKKYSIVFQALESSDYLLIIYRINSETKVKSSCRYTILSPIEVNVLEASVDAEESYELPSQYTLPKT